MSWYERVRPYAAGKRRDGLRLHAACALFRARRDLARLRRRPAICRIPPGPGHAAGAGRRLRDRASRRTCAGAARGGGRGADRLHLARGAEALRPERQPHRRRAIRSAPTPRCAALADLRGGRRDVLARRAAVLAAPADPARSAEIIQICGEEFHDMLRGIVSPARGAAPRAGARRRRSSNTEQTDTGGTPWTPTASRARTS